MCGQGVFTCMCNVYRIQYVQEISQYPSKKGICTKFVYNNFYNTVQVEFKF